MSFQELSDKELWETLQYWWRREEERHNFISRSPRPVMPGEVDAAIAYNIRDIEEEIERRRSCHSL